MARYGTSQVYCTVCCGQDSRCVTFLVHAPRVLYRAYTRKVLLTTVPTHEHGTIWEQHVVNRTQSD
jgi:hypothetical protein